MKQFLVLFSFLFCSFSYGGIFENITFFQSDIQIQADGSVWVTEQIEVNALGIDIKRGIYRDIPLNFELPDGFIRQHLEVKKTLRNGASETYRTEMIDGGVRIYLGSSEEELPHGKHRYELSYILDRTAYCNENVCEVLWNVNGNQWSMSIDTLSATISTPEGTKIISHDAWTGLYGQANKKDFITKSLSPSKQLFMTDRLKPGYNLTIGIVFDAEVMTELSSSTKWMYYFRDHSLLILGGLGFLISFIVNFILWMKYGIDPKKGTIIPQFYPPEGWSPAEISFLMNDGKEDDNMFAAQLLQLAVKGHLKITKKKTDSKEDFFVISYANDSIKKKELTKLEIGFLNLLLGKKDYTIIREKYNPRVAKAQEYLIQEIRKKQRGVYFRKNRKLFLPQYLFPVLTIIGMSVAYNHYEGPVWLIFVLGGLMIVMNTIFMRLFYQPTKKGRKMMDHILGLERFIKYADELRIKSTNKPDMNFDYFEENLPYAVALGKVDEWGEKFRTQDIEAQYRNSNYYIQGYPFYRLAFIGALSTVSASASVPPSSAGSSGGGFSGGGFSGGGAGGGGGGGW